MLDVRNKTMHSCDNKMSDDTKDISLRKMSMLLTSKGLKALPECQQKSEEILEVSDLRFFVKWRIVTTSMIVLLNVLGFFLYFMHCARCDYRLTSS